MISPLVYIFAGAAIVLALLFAAAAVLTHRHATTRSKRAPALRDYLAGGDVAEVDVANVDFVHELLARHEQRARAMQVTVGDLIRDEKLAVAAAEGARAAAERHWTPVVTPFYRIDRTESGGYIAEVRPPGRPAIRSRHETEAKARAWAEDTLWRLPDERGPGE